MKRLIFPAILLQFLFISTVRAGAPPSWSSFPEEVRNLVSQASSTDEAASATAIEALRNYGQEGVDAFLTFHETDFKSLTGEDARVLHSRLDQISQQKDSYYSGLFWNTNLDQAIAIAKATNKPILSLRMLGKLTEDLSCANSRFFRTLLYSNKTISTYLKDNYVLHWSSERPVPVVTIDFGDGRIMKRTVTGNSMHFVLDPNGKVIEAIPGLYNPNQFLSFLKDASALNTSIKGADETKRSTLMNEYHQARYEKISAMAEANNILINPEGELTLEAFRVERLTTSKAGVERPLLSSLSLSSPKTKIDPWKDLHKNDVLEDTQWGRVGLQMGIYPELDENTIALIRAKNPEKYADENALIKEVDAIENRLLIESAKNQFMLHCRLHQWMMEATEPVEMNALNDRAYAELFLTPATDPWLGMLPDNVFSAIENDGITVSK